MTSKSKKDIPLFSLTFLQLDDAKVVVEKLIPDVKFEVLEDKMIPNEEVELHGEDLTLFKRLVTLLDEVDDVQNVYHNVNM